MDRHLDIFPMPNKLADEVGIKFELLVSWFNGVRGAEQNKLYVCIVTDSDEDHVWRAPKDLGALIFQICDSNRSSDDEQAYPIRRTDYAKAKHEYSVKYAPAVPETVVVANATDDSEPKVVEQISFLWKYCVALSPEVRLPS